MKKMFLFFAAGIFCLLHAEAQNLAINTDGSAPNANAILDVKSNNKGILIPRMSSAERLAIPATKGLLVYDLNTNSFWYNNGAEWKAIAGSTAPTAGDAWLLNGNAGTDSTNFLGTTDNAPLRIRVNNLASGNIDHINNNAFWGYRSGALTTGTYNTGTGHEALANNTTGYSNSAFGRFALRMNTEGHSNTAVGMDALAANTIGKRNTAIGMLTLVSNTNGSENTALGYDVLHNNTRGGGNTAAGATALFSNTNGFENTVYGARAMHNNLSGSFNTSIGANTMVTAQGTGNTAVGYHAMWLAASASNNVAIGRFAMAYNQDGHSNTAVGDAALGGVEGSYNTGIGASTSIYGEDINNATAIGAGAIVDASNKVRIGNSAVTVIEGQVPFTTPSDGRFKFNVQEDVAGLSFINQLRPVTYQFDVKRFDNKSSSLYEEAQKMRRTGFIAQEVEKAAINTGFNFSGLIKPKTAEGHYSLSYDAFVVPLVKAAQELDAKVRSLEKQNEAQMKMIEELRKRLDALTGSK